MSTPFEPYTDESRPRSHAHKYSAESPEHRGDLICDNNLHFKARKKTTLTVCFLFPLWKNMTHKMWFWLFSQFCMERVWSYHRRGDSRAGSSGNLFPGSNWTHRGSEADGESGINRQAGESESERWMWEGERWRKDGWGADRRVNKA